MIYNDVLRRIRYTFDFSDDQMISMFALTGYTVSRAEISNWLKKEDDADFALINDKFLAIFLNGFIIHQRGRQEGQEPVVEKRLTNNIILRKLKIALQLKDDDILAILNLVGFHLSRHELSAFFRKTDHPHYRLCKDQVLRNFTYGMQVKYHKK